ncbi:hypothetical protein M0813_02242 [Anaeramoeba flamelloides]|uniref:Peptidase C1A papain C-terminal domain-containing protein n=1 Tax=Anaeramoeba flamelloides TaxID=1746091 RepID=A0ABQ8YQY3_9EUKA|nr:hypothetical protein M0813_02242 [Anaeramoeba flamelloides]
MKNTSHLIQIFLLLLLVSVCFSLPTKFDWRNVNGQNYCSVVRQQHLPTYCGSCYIFSSTSAFNDRVKIKYNNTKIDINISPQEIMNCANVAGCAGGSPSDVYAYIKKTGAVHETCSPYQAVQMECTAENICKRCPSYDKPCYAVENPKRWFASSVGSVSGETAMMNEIYKNGPVACHLYSDEQLEAWDGGDKVLISPPTNKHNHWISVVGWGYSKEQKVNYWIVRNSWGVEWNPTESSGGGFFNLIRGQNALDIEEICYYAIPK